MTATFKIENGDFVLNDATGRFVLLTDSQKLSHDIGLLMSTGAPNGAALDDLVGSIQEAVHAEASRRITSALQNYQALQRRFQMTQRTKAEVLARIAKVSVAPAKTTAGYPAKTAYVIHVAVLSQASVPATANVTLR